MYTLLKNAILIVLISVGLVFIFTKYIGYTEINYLFLAISFLYIVFAVIEAFNSSKIKQEIKKYTYFTDGFLAKRIIKIISFACCGFILLVSNSLIKYMALICFLIAITEMIVTIYRYIKHLCFIAIQDDLIIISGNKLDIIHSNNVAKIERRHDLTYIINKTNKTYTIRTDMMKEKDVFQQALNAWIEKYNIAIIPK